MPNGYIAVGEVQRLSVFFRKETIYMIELKLLINIFSKGQFKESVGWEKLCFYRVDNAHSAENHFKTQTKDDLIMSLSIEIENNYKI